MSKKIEPGLDEEVVRIARSGKLNKKTVCVMGSLLNMDRINQLLMPYGYKVDIGLNNNTSLCGKQIVNGTEYQVITPQELASMYSQQNVIIFVFSFRYWRAMFEQLEALGYKNNRQIFLLEVPSSIEKKMKYILKGRRIYKSLVRKYGKDTVFFVAIGPLGDNYMFCLFYKEYLSKHNIENYVFVGNSATEKIMSLREEHRFEKVETEDVLALENYYIFCCGTKKNLKFLQVWDTMFSFNPCRIRLEHKFSFLDSFRSYSFGLDSKMKPDFPTLKKDIAAEIFKKMNIKKGKTIIMAPYAYSIAERVPQRFWRVVAEKLSEKGYDIVLNIDSRNEENFLENVPDFMIPIRDIRECVEYAGNMLAMRSGICDIVADVEAKKVILYPKQYTDKLDLGKHRPDMEYGSLKNMELSTDAIELEFENLAEDNPYWVKLAGEVIAQF